MMKRLLISAMLVCASLFFALDVSAQLADPADTSYGLKTTGDAAGLSTTAGGADLPTRIGQLLNGALVVVGIVFLIITVYGGFKIMLSRGEAGSIKTGREAILYGIIGMVIIAAAYGITDFVVTTFVTNPTP